MSQKNQIAVSIPNAELQNITKLIADLQKAIAPYIITLTADERRSLLKMSDKSIAFVTKSLEYTKSNPEFVPAYLSVDDMQVDVNAVSQLQSLFQQVQQIADNLDDSLMLSGSEAYNAALLYYNNVKLAIKASTPNAKTIYDDLSKRYPGRPASTAVTPAPAPSK